MTHGTRPLSYYINLFIRHNGRLIVLETSPSLPNSVASIKSAQLTSLTVNQTMNHQYSAVLRGDTIMRLHTPATSPLTPSPPHTITTTTTIRLAQPLNISLPLRITKMNFMGISKCKHELSLAYATPLRETSPMHISSVWLLYTPA